MSDYVVHPAFNYGGTKLSGFWVGKYETSFVGTGTTSSSGEYNGIAKTAMIKAGVSSWRNITVSNIFTVCTELNKENNQYGLNTSDSIVDPHMMKNSEWGAVAYLSMSKYGINSRLWKNANANHITGNSGNRLDEPGNYSTNFPYKTTNGVKASTTGNTTGIYDMSGGSDEYVAGYINNGNSNLRTYGSTLINANLRYRDVYKFTTEANSNNYNNSKPTAGLGQPNSSTGHYGDAIWETSSSKLSSNGAWQYAATDFPRNTFVFFLYGGNCSTTTDAGVFYFNSTLGQQRE